MVEDDRGEEVSRIVSDSAVSAKRSRFPGTSAGVERMKHAVCGVLSVSAKNSTKSQKKNDSIRPKKDKTFDLSMHWAKQFAATPFIYSWEKKAWCLSSSAMFDFLFSFFSPISSDISSFSCRVCCVLTLCLHWLSRLLVWEYEFLRGRAPGLIIALHNQSRFSRVKSERDGPIWGAASTHIEKSLKGSKNSSL